MQIKVLVCADWSRILEVQSMSWMFLHQHCVEPPNGVSITPPWKACSHGRQSINGFQTVNMSLPSASYSGATDNGDKIELEGSRVKRGASQGGVHALVNGAVVPCLYALLQQKDEATYIRMWQYIGQVALALGIVVDPASDLIDFEAAAGNAIQRQFHNVQIAGCFFHLGQLVWRHLCQEGQRAIYLNNENFRMHIKMMTCTSFLPVDEVTAGFEALQESPAYDPHMDVVFDYFEDNYMWVGCSGTLIIMHHCSPSICGTHSSAQLTTTFLGRI